MLWSTLSRGKLLEYRASPTQMRGNSSPKTRSQEVSQALDIALLTATSTRNQRFGCSHRRSRVVAWESRLRNKQISPSCATWLSQPLLMMRVVRNLCLYYPFLTPVHPSDGLKLNLATDINCARNVRNCPWVDNLDGYLSSAMHKWDPLGCALSVRAVVFNLFARTCANFSDVSHQPTQIFAPWSVRGSVSTQCSSHLLLVRVAAQLLWCGLIHVFSVFITLQFAHVSIIRLSLTSSPRRSWNGKTCVSRPWKLQELRFVFFRCFWNTILQAPRNCLKDDLFFCLFFSGSFQTGFVVFDVFRYDGWAYVCFSEQHIPGAWKPTSFRHGSRHAPRATHFSPRVRATPLRNVHPKGLPAGVPGTANSTASAIQDSKRRSRGQCRNPGF